MEEKKFKDLSRTDKWQEVRDHFYSTQPKYEEFTSNHAEHIQNHFLLATEWAPLRNFFFERLGAAEFHWFFVQGVDALLNGLYVPAVSSLLNGIEASLRVTIKQRTNPEDQLLHLSPYKVLSNNLINDARSLDLPIECLAFPDEVDFDQKLRSEKPSKVDVEIVRQRNNICHGNILEYINRDLGPENSFFTPVSLRELSFQLLDISGAWAEQLGKFRRVNKLYNYL